MTKALLVVGAAVLAMLLGGVMAQAADQAAPATPAAPQVTPAKPEGPHGKGGCVFGKLGLTDEQKAQVKTILTAAREQAKNAPDREAKMKIMREAFDKIRTTVLTDEQRTKLADLKAKWHEGRGTCKKGPGKGTETPPAPSVPKGAGV
jgi:Spy/CpxP family protein refolding chaperone